MKKPPTTEQKKGWQKTWAKKHPDYWKTPRAQQNAMLKRARERAKKKGWEYSLRMNNVTFPDVCPVFGFPLIYQGGRGKQQYDSPSLDRIDSSKGYTPDNVQIMSNLANLMKQNATPEQLVQFAKYVLATYEP